MRVLAAATRLIEGPDLGPVWPLGLPLAGIDVRAEGLVRCHGSDLVKVYASTSDGGIQIQGAYCNQVGLPWYDPYWESRDPLHHDLYYGFAVVYPLDGEIEASELLAINGRKQGPGVGGRQIAPGLVNPETGDGAYIYSAGSGPDSSWHLARMEGFRPDLGTRSKGPNPRGQLAHRDHARIAYDGNHFAARCWTTYPPAYVTDAGMAEVLTLYRPVGPVVPCYVLWSDGGSMNVDDPCRLDGSLLRPGGGVIKAPGGR